MKTYEEIISYDCLKEGLRKSCLGVMWKDSVANYRMNAVKNTWKLRQDLLKILEKKLFLSAVKFYLSCTACITLP